MRFLAVVLVCCVYFIPSWATQNSSAKNSPTHQAETRKTQDDSRSQPAAEDVQALRQDIARMKALVQQMQSNLAFVDTSQSPLKHQFQLEIDMWQMLITEMERRLASSPAR